MGKAIAYDLYERVTGSNLLLVDKSRESLDEARKLVNKADIRVADLSNAEEIYRIIKDVDAAVSALPGKFGKIAWIAAVKAGVDMVDVSYSPDDPMHFHVQANDAGVTIVPDAGVAPGLSNMMAGRAYAQLEEVRELKIYVGGIPENPIPPLGYLVTWSPEDLIEEYVRPARVVKDGNIVEKPAVSELEKVIIPGVGELEAFLTDGLRTMLKTLKGVKLMEEKTLRWPGHAEKIELLKTLGYLDRKPVDLNGTGIPPADMTAKLFRERLKGDSKDIVVLRVIASGRSSLNDMEIEYRMVDRYDESTGFSAVARTTAFVATGILKLITEGTIPGPGVIPPEVIGMDENLFSSIAEWLSWRGIKILERITESRSIPSLP
ncbi:MAG: saccharopine dehydrogenase NADP-binding domain-containing protein [Candidatus Korarchaeota archaeon]|nr:saccharopine dehydrogenase NADP-binding domain-containing protein [Candidatus Korarchaeota archaeon]